MHKKRKDDDEIYKLSEQEKVEEIRLSRSKLDYVENTVAVWQMRHINSQDELINQLHDQIEIFKTLTKDYLEQMDAVEFCRKCNKENS